MEDFVANISIIDPWLSYTPMPAAPAELLEDDRPRELRSAIGRSKGRLTLEQHLDRLDYVLTKIPQDVWPSTARLADQYMGQSAIIVGGGPSLADTFDELRWQVHEGNCKVFAPNKSHDWLIKGERDGKKKWKRLPLIPDFGVLVDPSDWVVDYMTPHPKVKYLLGTTVHMKVLAKFMKAEAKAYMWVPTYEGDGSDIRMAAERYIEEMHFVSGGSTVGLRINNIAASFGMSTCDLHGFDSCYAPGTKNLYAYQKERTVHALVDATAKAPDGSKFRFITNEMMAKQAMEFMDMAKRLPELTVDGKMRPLRVRVHGDGLIPWLAWKAMQVEGQMIEHAHPERMEAKYGSHKEWDYYLDKPGLA